MLPILLGLGVFGGILALARTSKAKGSYRQAVVDAALSEIGPGNPVLYWESSCVERLEPKKDWCGAFVLWSLHKAGLALDVCWNEDGTGFVGPSNLPTTKTPEPGDIYYQQEPYQHHAVVESLKDGILVTIDGNSPNVSRNERPVPTQGIVFYSIQPFLDEVGQ